MPDEVPAMNAVALLPVPNRLMSPEVEVSVSVYPLLPKSVVELSSGYAAMLPDGSWAMSNNGLIKRQHRKTILLHIQMA